MISSVIIAFSLCSHESRAQHLCEYLVGDCAFLMFSPYGRGVPRTITLDHFPVVFPELLPWIIFICPGPECSVYVQDHGVLGTVMLSARSTFLWDLRSRRVERLLCFFVFFAIEKVCQHDVRCLSWIVFFFSLPLLRNAKERKAWRGCVRLMSLFTCVLQCRNNYATYLKKRK